MNAARDTDPIEVRGNLSRGDRVLARTRRAGAIGGGNWYPGRVDKVAARGVFVVIDHGGKDFYRWSDVRRDPDRSVMRRPRPVDDGLPEPGPSPEPGAPAPPPSSSSSAAPEVDLEGILDDDPTIGQVFYRWRDRAGLSQERASRRTKLTQTLYSTIERDARPPTDDQLIAFAQATGLDLVELIDIRAKGAPKSPLADKLNYIDLTPAQAWKVLGLTSVHALWARLGRYEDEGQVDLGGSIIAYRRGRRWLVRFPRNHAAAAIMADERADPEPEEHEPEPELSTKPSNFLKWSEGLQHYVPVPSDPDLRRRWFEVVRDLFEIWKKDQR